MFCLKIIMKADILFIASPFLIYAVTILIFLLIHLPIICYNTLINYYTLITKTFLSFFLLYIFLYEIKNIIIAYFFIMFFDTNRNLLDWIQNFLDRLLNSLELFQNFLILFKNFLTRIKSFLYENQNAWDYNKYNFKFIRIILI